MRFYINSTWPVTFSFTVKEPFIRFPILPVVIYRSGCKSKCWFSVRNTFVGFGLSSWINKVTLIVVLGVIPYPCHQYFFTLTTILGSTVFFISFGSRFGWFKVSFHLRDIKREFYVYIHMIRCHSIIFNTVDMVLVK